MTNLPNPPSHVKLPTAILCAPVGDSLIVTMGRILGLCWAQGYRKSEPYSPDDLAERLGRSRSTLYSHLKELQDLQWLQVSHSQRRLVLQPLVRVSARKPADPDSRTDDPPLPPVTCSESALRQALADAGISGQMARHLIQQDIDPIHVRAWDLWTWGEEQDWINNPAGYIVNRLRQGDEAPEEYVELARLAPKETKLIHQAWIFSEHTQGWPSIRDNDKLLAIAPLWVDIHQAMRQAGAPLILTKPL